MTMTPERLREHAKEWDIDGRYSIAEIFRAHAAALEEIERLKAPASEGEIAETLKELREVGFYCEATVQDVIEIIESLAAKVAELEDDKRCLTVANEAMTNQANNAITRAERAEAERDKLKAAIRWALGYEDWPERKDGEGAFYWRKELRRRADFQRE